MSKNFRPQEVFLGKKIRYLPKIMSHNSIEIYQVEKFVGKKILSASDFSTLFAD